jgi:hypothetical protein
MNDNAAGGGVTLQSAPLDIQFDASYESHPYCQCKIFVNLTFVPWLVKLSELQPLRFSAISLNRTILSLFAICEVACS